jgi:hypothetical protein
MPVQKSKIYEGRPLRPFKPGLPDFFFNIKDSWHENKDFGVKIKIFGF